MQKVLDTKKMDQIIDREKLKEILFDPEMYSNIFKAVMDHVEETLVESAMGVAGTQIRAARLLGVSRSQLLTRIKHIRERYGMSNRYLDDAAEED